MEKQKNKHTAPRTPIKLAFNGIMGSMAILFVPTFCVWSITFVDIIFSSSQNTDTFQLAQSMLLCMPIIGLLTAIATAYYTVDVMKLYRASGILSLTTIMSASTMILTYLIATRIL